MNAITYPVFTPDPDLSPRGQLEAAIEAALQLLNDLDLDPDLETDDEDCCDAEDDIGTLEMRTRCGHGIGSEDDAEDDDPLEWGGEGADGRVRGLASRGIECRETVPGPAIPVTAALHHGTPWPAEWIENDIAHINKNW